MTNSRVAHTDIHADIYIICTCTYIHICMYVWMALYGCEWLVIRLYLRLKRCKYAAGIKRQMRTTAKLESGLIHTNTHAYMHTYIRVYVPTTDNDKFKNNYRRPHTYSPPNRWQSGSASASTSESSL